MDEHAVAPVLAKDQGGVRRQGMHALTPAACVGCEHVSTRGFRQGREPNNTHSHSDTHTSRQASGDFTEIS